MALEKAIADLTKGAVAPCYLLCGDEEYLIHQTLERILDILIAPADRDFGLFVLEGDPVDVEALRDHILSPSLLGGRKVVLIRNASLFQSQSDLPKLVSKIRDLMLDQPRKAAGLFLTFMSLAGFDWEDVQNEGWRRITDEQWRKALSGDSADDRDKWLPGIIDICSGLGLTRATSDQSADGLSVLLDRGLPEGNCLIFTAEAVDARKKIYKTITSKGVVLRFEKAKNETAVRGTFKQEAQRILDLHGKRLTPQAMNALGRKTGFQLRQSLNELGKLIGYVGDRSDIEETDIEVVVGKTREESIFELTGALAEKNAKAALVALTGLLDQGVHHLMILTMIIREIRLLLQAAILVRSGLIPRFNPSMEYGWFSKNLYPAVSEVAKSHGKGGLSLMGSHPFVIYNALRNCGRFSYPSLVGFLDDLVDVDRAMKSSGGEPRLLLENFLIKACSKAS